MTSKNSDQGGNKTSSRRTFLTTTGVAGLTLAAGCLGSGDDDTDGNGGDSTDNDGFGEAGQMTDGGTVTINFWPAWGGFYEATITEMVEQFESEHDNINIETNLLTNYRDSRTTAFTNIRGGDPEQMPDIAHFDTNDSIVARDTGWFQPVENLLENVGPEDLLQPAVATSTINGTMWGAPFYISNVTMHYNADMVEAAGYDPAEPPTSLQEVREIGEAAVNEAGADYAVTIPNDSWFVESWVSEQDEFWMDNKNGQDAEPTTVYATESQTLDIVNWWSNLAKDDLYFNGGIEAWTQPESVFLDGRAPFNFNSSTSTAWVSSEDFETRTARLPTLDGEGIGHSRGAAEMWIVDKNRSDEERDALRQFVEYVLAPEQQAAFHKASGYYPAHQESWDVLESESWFDENPRYQVLRDQIDSWEESETNVGLYTGQNPAITSELTSQMNSIFGGADPQEAMNTVKEEAEIALARYQRQS